MTENIFNLIAKLKTNQVLEREHGQMICHLSVAEYRGIMARKTGEGVSCQEMAKIMNLSPSRSSRVIDNLVRKGYFIRKVCKNDRRAVAVTLSDKGREVRERIEKNREQLENNLKNQFSDEEMMMIRQSLRMLIDYFV